MDLKSFNIGNVSVDNPFVLAPMSGITTSIFRRFVKICSEDMLGLMVTEFLSIEALTRKSLRTHQMLEFQQSERPLSVQIFGRDPEKMGASAEIVQEKGADIVDINCGCPAPKVVRKGGGASLMRDPEKLKKIFESVVKSVSIPVTVKIRSGWNDQELNFLEISQLAQDCGLSMVCLHPRTRKDGYSGQANWDFVKQLKQNLSIPVIGSGDVRSVQDAETCVALSGADGVMVGRAAMANPFLFKQLTQALHNESVFEPTLEQKLAALDIYFKMLIKEAPEKTITGKMKQITAKFTRGLRGGAVLRQKIFHSQTVEEIFEAVALFRAGASSDPSGVGSHSQST